MKVFVTVIEDIGSLCSVWAQTDFDGYDEVEALVSSFNGKEDRNVTGKKVNEGEIVLAKYEEQWYRAQTLPGKKCFFIDFGNTEVINDTDIVLASANYFEIPPLAVQYILADVIASNGQQWSFEERAKLQEHLHNCEYEAEILSPGSAGVPPTIRLTTGGENVASQLVASGVGRQWNNNHLNFMCIPNSLLPTGSHHVYVQYSTSAVKFWVQLASNEQISAELGDKLVELTESGLNRLNPAKIHTCLPCVALYEDIPYRAVITSVNHNQGKCSVYFTDYGNTEEVNFSEVLQLPSDIAKTPALVAECSLSGQAVRNTDFSKVIESDTIYALVQHRLDSGLYIVSLSDTKSVPAQNPKPSMAVSPTRVSHNTAHAKYSPIQFNLGASHEVCISHVQESGQFYCQLVENAHRLDDLMSALQHAAAKPLLPQAANEDTPCLVSKDSLFYRGKIVSKHRAGAVVNLVDFGNEELVSEDNLYVIETQFMQLPTQAIHCNLDGAESRPHEVVTKVLNRFNSARALVGKVVLKTGKCYDMDLYDDNGTKILDMVDKAVRNSSRVTENSGPNCAVSPAEAVIGTQEQIYVTVALSNNEFFAQLSKCSMDALDTMQERLLQYYSKNQRALTSARTGDYCVAMFSEDEHYYRARVVDSDGQRCQVSFVDYGNEEMKTVSELYALAPEFCALPAQGIHCSLAEHYTGMPDALVEGLVDATLVVSLEKKLRNAFSITIPDVKENSRMFAVVDKFVKRKSASPIGDYRDLDLTPGSIVQAEVIHVEDPGRFFCQPAQSQDALHDLMDKIDAYCSVAPPLSAHSAAGKRILGNPVLAKYSADDGWYRALVTGFMKSTNKIEVFFVDYGNLDHVADADLRPMQAEFLALEAQAIRCCLYGVDDPSAPWSDPLTNRFSEMLEGAKVKLHINRFNAGSEMYAVEVENEQGAVINESFLRTANRLAHGYSAPNKTAARPSPPAQKTANNPRSSIERTLLRSPSSMSFKPLDIRLNEHMAMNVVYADSPGKFWCQLGTEQRTLEQLMEQLQGVYSRLGEAERPMLNLIGDRVCCAQYSADGQWYRAKVVSTSGGMVQVQFVDYGNVEEVKPWNVKELSPEFFEAPAQAFPCSMFNMEPAGGEWSAAARRRFEELVMEDSVMGLAVARQQGVYVMELIDKNSQSVEDAMVASGHAKLKTIEVVPSKPPPMSARKLSLESNSSAASSRASSASLRSLKYAEAGFRKGDLPEVYVSYSINPSEFYVQQSGDKLSDLTDSIQKLYSCLGDGEMTLGRPEVGTVCCAQYDQDDQWYRGKVTAVERGRVKVKFVDWGNDAWVPMEKTKQLIKSLSTLPTQAIKCKLDGATPTGNTWSDAAIDAFDDAVLDKCLIGEVRGVGEIYSLHLVHVNKDDTEVDIAAVMARAGHARVSSSGATRAAFKKLDLRMNHQYDVGISWVVSLQEFYCQLAEHAQQLCGLSEQLTDHYEKLKLSEKGLNNPKPGDVCVSYYPADGSWYRSVVIDTKDNVAKVQYIDYGNSETVPQSKLKQISDQFLYQPRFSFKCALKMDDSNTRWDKQVSGLFERLTRQRLKCSIQSREGDNCIVDLLDQDGQRVSDLVLGRGGRPQQRNERQGGFSENKRSFGDRNDNRGGGGVGRQDSSDGNRTSGFRQNDRGGGGGFGAGGGFNRRQEDGGRREMGGDRGFGSGGSGDRGFGNREDRSAGFRGREDRSGGFENREGRSGGFGDRQSVGSGRFGGRDERSDRSSDSGRSGGFGNRDERRGGGGSDSGRSGGFGNRDERRGGSGSDRGGRSGGFDNRDDRRGGSGGFGDKRSFGNKDSGFNDKRSSGFGGRDQNRPGGFGDSGSGRKDRGGDYGNKGGSSGGFGSGGGFSAAPAVVEVAWDDTPAVAPAAQPVKATPPPAKKSLPAPDLTVFSNSETNKGYVAVVHSPLRFFLQLVHKEDEITDLADKITKEYSALSAEDKRVSKVAAGDLCCAKYAEDEAWYRGVVESVQDSTINVLFVDYGNLETVPLSDIRTLSDSYTSVPPLAYDCSLQGFRKFTEDDTTKFNELTEEGAKVFTVDIKSSSKPLKCILYDEDAEGEEKTSVAEQLPSWASQPVQKQYPDVQVPTSEAVAYVSHIDDPAKFHIQLQEQEDALNVEMEKVAEAAESAEALCEPQVGDPCLAQFSEDSAWYRAIVMETSEVNATVHYIDYGNGESTSRASLKDISDELLSAAPFAIEASLADVTAPETGFTVAVIDKFQELTLEKELSLIFVTTTQPCLVNIKEGDDDINAKVLEAMTALAEVKTEPVVTTQSVVTTESVAPVSSEPAKAVSLPRPALSVFNSDDTNQAYISIIHSPRRFFIQLAHHDDDIANLADQITNEYSALGVGDRALSSVHVGQYCCAKYAEDGAWYRAVVESNDTSSPKVLFVDYGNLETVPFSDIRSLSENYASMAPLALECTLHGLNTFTEHDTAKLNELSEEGGKLFKVVLKSESFPLQCELVDPENSDISAVEHMPSWSSQSKDEQVSDAGSNSAKLVRYPSIPELELEKHQAFVSHVESPDELYIQLVSEEATRNELDDRVDKAYGEHSVVELQAPAIGTACCAKCPEEVFWYRARVTSVDADKIGVIFVDNGRSGVVDKCDVRVIEPQFLDQPPTAYKARLYGITAPESGYSQTISDHLQELTANKILRVEIKSGAQPCEVVVFAQGKNVNESIMRMLAGEPDKEADGMTRADSQDSFKSAEDEQGRAGVEPAVSAASERSLVVGDSASVYVSHHDSPACFWVQLASEENQLHELSDQLQAEFQDGGDHVLDDSSKGSLCAAKYTDESWYRACVTNEAVSVEGEVEVMFIDYGNSHCVPAAQLMTLPDHLLSAPAQAIQCVLSGVRAKDGEWSPAVNDSFSELVSDETLTMHIVQAQTSISSLQSFVVNLRRADGVCISESLLALSGVEPSLAPLDASPTRHSEASSVDDFQQAVSDTEESAEPEAVIEPDGKIIDIPPEGIAEIGKETETVECSETEAGETERGEQNEDDIERISQAVEELKVASPEIKELTESELLGAQSGSESDQERIIETPSEASDINGQESKDDIGQIESDAQTNELVSVQLKNGSRVEGTMLYVNSPSQFWVQVADEATVSDMEALSEQLHAACAGQAESAVDVAVDVSVGCLVAAYCDGDSEWYRARVTAQNGGDTVTVQYVDYGNSEDVPLSSVKALAEQYRKVPAQAVECACADIHPATGDDWDGDAADLFNEITLEKKLLVDVQDANEAGVYQVRLLDMGIPVANRMIAEGVAMGTDGRCDVTQDPSILDETAFEVVQSEVKEKEITVPEPEVKIAQDLLQSEIVDRVDDVDQLTEALPTDVENKTESDGSSPSVTESENESETADGSASKATEESAVAEDDDRDRAEDGSEMKKETAESTETTDDKAKTEANNSDNLENETAEFQTQDTVASEASTGETGNESETVQQLETALDDMSLQESAATVQESGETEVEVTEDTPAAEEQRDPRDPEETLDASESGEVEEENDDKPTEDTPGADQATEDRPGAEADGEPARDQPCAEANTGAGAR